jgi:hypothetical protein
MRKRGARIVILRFLVISFPLGVVKAEVCGRRVFFVSGCVRFWRSREVLTVRLV